MAAAACAGRVAVAVDWLNVAALDAAVAAAPTAALLPLVVIVVVQTGANWDSSSDLVAELGATTMGRGVIAAATETAADVDADGDVLYDSMGADCSANVSFEGLRLLSSGTCVVKR